jgi:hypothetical protein
MRFIMNGTLWRKLLKLTLIGGMVYVAYRASKPIQTGRPHIDCLIKSDREELDRLFISGQTPTMDEMQGTYDGNALSGVLMLNNQWVKNLINLGWLPWKGKTFEMAFSKRDGGQGSGVNRLSIGPLRFLRFYFDTQITSPLVGPNNVFRLNYDIPGNPWYIRRIRDDVRRIGDGLYLGTANFRIGGAHKFIIYFVLESTGR